MMQSAIEVGFALLLEQEAAAAAERELVEAADLARLVGTFGSSILSTIDALVATVAGLEARQAELMACVMATRVRRPVRDETGAILYVVDELTAPVWAQPMSEHD